MATPIRVLIVEDSEDDTALLINWIELGGYAPEYRQVQTETEFRKALQAESWDVILADFALPVFDVDSAFEIYQRQDLDLPFIVISGVVSMERVVRLIKEGAYDFIAKDDLIRLVPAIERGLREAETRREKRHVEMRRREGEARFKDFASASADWFWEMDADLRFTYVSDNVERVTGNSPDWYLGKTRKEAQGDDYDAEAWAKQQRTLDERKAFRGVEFKRTSSSGEIIWMETSGVPVYADDGSFTGYRGAASNIGEQRRMEEQLRQAQKMEAVGQLTGGLAHDFNNLLATIMGNAELLAEKIGDEDESIVAMTSAAIRGAELTQRLLAFSRQQPLQPKPTDVSFLVTDMMDLLQRSLGEMIEIKVTPAQERGTATVDSRLLESALLNLVINARDAMSGAGSLVIETSNETLDETDRSMDDELKAGNYVVLSVTDDGAGMSADVLARVFDPFYTTKEMGKGSGLGLSMVYGFIRQSGGHVAITSEPGRGTTVKLYLPQSDAPAIRRETKAREETTPRGNGELVLLVEDDEHVRRLTVKVLEGLGYRVHQVVDGNSALAAFDDLTDISLLLTDMMLPGGMSGHDLATEIGKRGRSGLKVLYMSGYPAQSVQANGWMNSGTELLSKPFRRHELANKLRNVLDQSEANAS